MIFIIYVKNFALFALLTEVLEVIWAYLAAAGVARSLSDQIVILIALFLFIIANGVMEARAVK